MASNLNLEVRNGANQLLGSFNIGQGYEPGAGLPTVNGVAVTVPSGVVNPGDTYSVDVTGNPDRANILTALGLNTLFHGDTAGGLVVRSDLLTNPERLSASLTGQPGDSTNLSRLTALRNAPTLASGTQNLRQFYDGLVGDVGIQVQSLDQNQTAKQTLGFFARLGQENDVAIQERPPSASSSNVMSMAVSLSLSSVVPRPQM